MIRVLLIALALVVAPSALARTGDSAPALDISGSFAQQHERIRARLADGETYKEITGQQQAEVLAALGRIESVLGGATTLDDLTRQERADLFNDQEVVNTILTQAREDSRLLCTREKTVGSHRPTTICVTVAERRRNRDLSQAEFQRRLRVLLPLEGDF